MFQTNYTPQIKPGWVYPPNYWSTNVKRWHDLKGLPHPVLYLPMWEGAGGTIYDYGGNGHSGVLTSGPVWNGNFVQFDGSDDYISIADSVDFDFLNTNTATYTVIFIFRTTQTGADMTNGTNGPTITERRRSGGTTDQIYRFGIHTDGKLGWNIRTDTDYNQMLSSSTAINDGKWHFGAGVKNGSAWEIYVNGASEGTLTNNVNPDEGSIMTIGCRTKDNNSREEYFDGGIAAKYLYQDVLDSNQVSILYEEPCGALYPVSVPSYFFVSAVAAAWPRGNPFTRVFTGPFGGPI